MNMNATAEKVPFDDFQTDVNPALCLRLRGILHARQFTAVFQPILDLRQATVVGYEGLIRGPAGSPLHAPVDLFRVARACGLVAELEYLARRVVLESFARMDYPGKVFLNVSPDILLQDDSKTGETLKYIDRFGLQPSQVIIEITENTPTLDYRLLRDATRHYRDMGFEIAIDDLGEGFSGLRLWSEIRPNYVKIDKHFVQNIHLDPVKLQFVRSIQEIASKSGARVIAEGIESSAELAAVRNLGVAYGQGYHIARPNATPLRQVSREFAESLSRQDVASAHVRQDRVTVEKLLKRLPWATPTCNNECVLKMFDEDETLYSIPVVRDGRPLGLLSRYSFFDRFARPYRRELYGRHPCETMMDDKPLIVERTVSLHDLSDLILESEPHHLSVGFIITDNGQYLGMGSGHDLLRLVTQMQINAARYANPLTLLPGNVPISEQIDSLLQAGVSFVACYCDLDHFKPFNDVYGYRKGDEVIQQTGRLLAKACGPHDFLGHIGGDDFIVLFQTEHWEERCQELLRQVAEAFLPFYSEADRLAGGIETEDRQGQRCLHPPISLSIGAVVVEARYFQSHHDVSLAAAIAKKQAKKIPGNSLFVERRGAAPASASETHG